MKQIIVTGYPSLDRIIKLDKDPKIGFTSNILNGRANDIYYGGCSVNISCLLSKIGIDTKPHIRVGEDFKESGFKDYLLKHNVKLDNVSQVSNSQTSFAYLIESIDGGHITLFHPGAMDKANFKPYDKDAYNNVDYVIMTINSYEDNKEILKIVKEKDIPLVFGMKLDEIGFPFPLLKEILESTKILFANENEQDTIVKEYNLNNIKDLFKDSKMEIIIITKGKYGSTIYTKDEEYNVKIVEGIKLVDPAGAGDAYMAGFMYGYLNNKSLKTCGELGSTLSSFVIEELGCTTNAPTLEEFLERHKNNY